MFYRKAVAPCSPTLPLGGYVGFTGMKEDATPSGLRHLGIEIQGSRNGNPGLEVITASR